MHMAQGGFDCVLERWA